MGANSGRTRRGARSQRIPEREACTWTSTFECLDGNEAAARIAYALSEVISIYPITPASPMAEHCDDWSAAGRPNLWGKVPDVVEMQSEAGAAGALHGALQKGALATTFTASQGLLLMIPNMFKIAGELTPAVIHVAARTVATHALSIFGDHSDVMHARTTGWAMLAAGSVQEAHDFALVAHAATLRARVPVPPLLRRLPDVARDQQDRASSTSDDIRALVRDDDVLAFRDRGLTPGCARSSAARPRTRTSSSRRARHPTRSTWPCRASSRRSWTSSPTRTGRRYGLVDYHGAPDAERVIIVMGSASGADRGDRRHAGRRRASRSGCCGSGCSSRSPPSRSWPPCRPPFGRSRSSIGRRSRARSASRSTSRSSRRWPRRWTAKSRRSRRRPGSSAGATACHRRR